MNNPMDGESPVLESGAGSQNLLSLSSSFGFSNESMGIEVFLYKEDSYPALQVGRRGGLGQHLFMGSSPTSCHHDNSITISLILSQFFLYRQRNFSPRGQGLITGASDHPCRRFLMITSVCLVPDGICPMLQCASASSQAPLLLST